LECVQLAAAFPSASLLAGPLERPAGGLQEDETSGQPASWLAKKRQQAARTPKLRSGNRGMLGSVGWGYVAAPVPLPVAVEGSDQEAVCFLERSLMITAAEAFGRLAQSKALRLDLCNGSSPST
jgi:hypothetical protein